MPVTPQNVYNALLASPGATLKTYPIRIHGSPGASGVVAFCLKYRGASHRPGTVRGTGKMHATDAYDMRTMATVNNFGGVAGGRIFNAHSIQMDANIQAMTPYLLGANGPSIMVTGQLSGCSFVMSAGQAGVNVAHVRCQPGQGAALATQLAQTVANSQVYGATDTVAGDYDVADRVASVIGVRSGGQWRIYAQKQDAASGDYQIKSVYQIWPRRQRQ